MAWRGDQELAPAAGAPLLLSRGGGGARGETVVQGRGGQWTDVTPDRLAEIAGAAVRGYAAKPPSR